VGGQWRSNALRGPGSTVTWGPSLSLPSTSPPSPSPPSFPPLPLPSPSPLPRSGPKIRLGGLAPLHYSGPQELGGPGSLNRLNPRFIRHWGRGTRTKQLLLSTPHTPFLSAQFTAPL